MMVVPEVGFDVAIVLFVVLDAVVLEEIVLEVLVVFQAVVVVGIFVEGAVFIDASCSMAVISLAVCLTLL